jgi:hypothetical protein
VEPIRIPITLSPHIPSGKPRGYYVLAHRLFPKGAPILRREQFVGFNGESMVLSVEYPAKWASLVAMNIYADVSLSTGHRRTFWFDKCKLTPMHMGFRIYLPSRILRPGSKQEKIETTGIFQQVDYGSNNSIFYLELPKITPRVVLGQEILI